MAEDKAEPKSKKENVVATKTIVVEQLPTQSVNKAIDEQGNEFALMTRDEALTEILDIARALKKGLL